ncbi:hypothetical protein CHU98_g926 [Xylaria longipes]|nr:hypothetical protein CHU98_g926 [Xylaria longipes]
MINKRVGVGLHPQHTLQEFRLRLLKGRKNLLLDLPPELRVAIYGLVVGKGCVPTRRIPIAQWRMPSLAQVNRQLRNEVIPVHFGRDGGFELLLLYEHGGPCDSVSRFCKHFSQYLQYVKYLDINVEYTDLKNFCTGRESRVEVRLFLIFSESCVAEGKTGLRIGNDETDWDDYVAAAEAFEEPEAIYKLEYEFRSALNIRGPSFSFDLCLLAKHAKLANRWIQLSRRNNKNGAVAIIEEAFPLTRPSRIYRVPIGD